MRSVGSHSTTGREKEGRKEGRKDGWMEGRNDGRKQASKEARKQGIKEARKEGRKEGKDGVWNQTLFAPFSGYLRIRHFDDVVCPSKL